MQYGNSQEKFRNLNYQIKPYTLGLLRQLLPVGELFGHEYVALTPTRADKNLGSFRININTSKWADFATVDKGGDIILLWVHVKGINQIGVAYVLKAIVECAE